MFNTLNLIYPKKEKYFINNFYFLNKAHKCILNKVVMSCNYQTKKTRPIVGVDASTAVTLLTLIGILDILVALAVLIKPIQIVLLWIAFWGFWTALLRPLTGSPIWDLIERSSNFGAPLALIFLYGWPKNLKDWWK